MSQQVTGHLCAGEAIRLPPGRESGAPAADGPQARALSQKQESRAYLRLRGGQAPWPGCGPDSSWGLGVPTGAAHTLCRCSPPLGQAQCVHLGDFPLRNQACPPGWPLEESHFLAPKGMSAFPSQGSHAMDPASAISWGPHNSGPYDRMWPVYFSQDFRAVSTVYGVTAFSRLVARSLSGSRHGVHRGVGGAPVLCPASRQGLMVQSREEEDVKANTHSSPPAAVACPGTWRARHSLPPNSGYHGNEKAGRWVAAERQMSGDPRHQFLPHRRGGPSYSERCLGDDLKSNKS